MNSFQAKTALVDFFVLASASFLSLSYKHLKINIFCQTIPPSVQIVSRPVVTSRQTLLLPRNYQRQSSTTSKTIVDEPVQDDDVSSIL